MSAASFNAALTQLREGVIDLFAFKRSDNEKKFKLQEVIALNPSDILEICLLLQLATADILKGLVEHAKS